MPIDLPPLDLPAPQHLAASLSAREAAALDAIFLVVPSDRTPAAFTRVPDAERWRGLHQRQPARAGAVRHTTLGNAQQTTCVLGYLGPEATAFDRLALSGRMVKCAIDRGLTRVAIATQGLEPVEAEMLEALLAALYAQTFELASFRSRPRAAPRALRQVLVAGARAPDFPRTLATARAGNLARWLTSLPPNFLTARDYRRLITQLARTYGLKLTWLDERALAREKAGAFLAVAAANAQRDAGIAHLSYVPARSGRQAASRARHRADEKGPPPDLALVGKGILFDTGGTNLKPHKSMLDMHTDMAGSAVALATLAALAELRVPFSADAWLAITENQTGPAAYKPQDIVTAANGVTIQVIHTDAEGRMALADTLALASRTRPRCMIDYATLTGACVYALTERISGVFTNRPALVPQLIEAGAQSGERVWNFPFESDFDAELESKVADVVQCAVDGKGDHILAARFLNRFVDSRIAWVHMDLSSATRNGGLGHVTTDVTGFGVRLTLDLLLRERLLEHLPAMPAAPARSTPARRAARPARQPVPPRRAPSARSSR